jgi:CrcB protein
VSASGFLAVGIGAAFGAWLRWWFAILLNAKLAGLPLGTLTANVAGGFLIGVCMEFFSRHIGLAPEIRLFAITGFLGGLTTFSTFSAEVVDTLLRGHYGWGLAILASHLAGSLLATAAGIFVVRSLAGG